jgi:hypothetical protein
VAGHLLRNGAAPTSIHWFFRESRELRNKTNLILVLFMFDFYRYVRIEHEPDNRAEHQRQIAMSRRRFGVNTGRNEAQHAGL